MNVHMPSLTTRNDNQEEADDQHGGSRKQTCRAKLNRNTHKYIPVGAVASFGFIAGHDVGCAGLGGIPVRVRVVAAVPALGARERGEVTPCVDDDRCPLRRGAHVHIREVGAVP